MEPSTHWTDQEVADLLNLGLEEFLQQYPHRTYHAARHKKLRVTRQMARERNAPLPAQLPEEEVALERLFHAYKLAATEERRVFGRHTREEHWYAPDDVGAPIGICFQGDVHIGGSIEYDRFEDDLALIRDTDGLYMVGMGDLIDNYKPQAKSGNGLYHAVFANSGLQIAFATTRYRWVRGKIIALCGGNHEAFDGQWAGIDRLPALARDVEAAYFTEAGGSIFVYLGTQRYHLVVKHHHAGGSRINKGARARKLWEEWPWVFDNADVVVLAHLHEPHLETPIRKGRQIIYLQTGTYKTSDEWAEDRGYRPAYGVPLVIFYPDERKMIPFPGEHFRDGVRFLQMERDRYLERARAA